MRLTAAEVRTLQCAPGKSEQVIFDETLPGFGLRLRATGAQTWLVQYAVHGRTRRIFLGPPTLVDASKARSMAKDLLASVRLGEIRRARRWPLASKRQTPFGRCYLGFSAANVLG
jgi:Arm DNA-binding domain